MHEILPEILVTPAQLGAVDKVCVFDMSLDQYKGIWMTNWPVEGIEFEGDKLKYSFDEVKIVALFAEILYAMNIKNYTLKGTWSKRKSSGINIVWCWWTLINKRKSRS